MDFSYATAAAIAMGAVGLGLGTLLGIASQKFAVEIDPKVEEIEEALPGTNEGACGYPSCEACATAIAGGEAPTNACIVGGHEVAEVVAKIMGVGAESAQEQPYPVILCGGGKIESKSLATYIGVENCAAASLAGGGGKACAYGCLGFGDCSRACPFDALSISEDGLPEVDLDKCTGCGVCVEACPRNLIVMRPRSEEVVVACSSLGTAREVKKVCKVGCVACGLCVKVCPVDAITMESNLAKIDPEICNNCGDCIEKCPTKCIISTSILLRQKESLKKAIAT